MENQFFVDSKHLSEAALKKKHQLENDPSSRQNHMAYLEGMEQIDSNVCMQVLSQMEAYEPLSYTEKDVQAALGHEVCSIEDFKASFAPESKTPAINSLLF